MLVFKNGSIINEWENPDLYCVNTSDPMDKCYTSLGNKSRQMTEKAILCFYWQDQQVVCIRLVAHCISFLSRKRDVMAFFLFGACSVQTCF